MIKFKDFIKESKELPSNKYIDAVIEDNEKVYILIGGTLGAGKSTWVTSHLPNVKLIDADEFALELANGDTSNEKLRSVAIQAIKMKQAAVESALMTGTTFIEMGTSANSQSTLKKIQKAKALGFTTLFILIATTPEEAIKRNHQRIESGQRGVSPENEYRIYQAYDDVKKTFSVVKRSNFLDFYFKK